MKKMLLVLSLFAFLGASNVARADSIIPVLVGVTTSDGGTTWDWEYWLSLSPFSTATPFVDAPGDTAGSAMVTLFDFHGFLSVVSAPVGWSTATFLTGPLAPGADCSAVPPVACPPDNPGEWNVLAGYGTADAPGAALEPVIDGGATGHIFASLIIKSSQPGPAVFDVEGYWGQDIRTASGSPQTNLGTYDGPGVPEPTSLLLLSMGLLGLVGFSRRAKKS